MNWNVASSQPLRRDQSSLARCLECQDLPLQIHPQHEELKRVNELCGDPGSAGVRPIFASRSDLRPEIFSLFALKMWTLIEWHS